jgi:hypothetical protein
VAIIEFGETKCPLCGKPLLPRDKLITTVHFLDDGDPLQRFSGVAIHYDCFQQWRFRKIFVAKYNHEMGQWHHMDPDGTVHKREPDPWWKFW